MSILKQLGVVSSVKYASYMSDVSTKLESHTAHLVPSSNTPSPNTPSSNTPSSNTPSPNTPSPSKPITCFIDGSCIDNGKASAKGGYAVVFPEYSEHTTAEKLEGIVTNNRAEYKAFLKALEIVDIIDPSRLRLLIVYTDSKLLLDSVTKWLGAWERNKWKKADGKLVKNRDLLEQIIVATKRRRVSWHHIKAHTNNTDFASINNAKADQLAKYAAQK